MQATACTGDFRVGRGKWVIPRGMTPQQCTYCEWCITNKCVQLEEGYTVKQNLNGCLCDCPVKHTHGSIQIYNCGKHNGLFGLCDLGRCRACFRDAVTESSAYLYCGACSASFGICEVCGVNAAGLYPMRPIAMMLSVENGRGSTEKHVLGEF